MAIDDKKVNQIVDMTFHRLGIPVDPTNATINQGMRVLVMKSVLDNLKTHEAILGLDEALEVTRAVCDCIELAYKVGAKHD